MCCQISKYIYTWILWSQHFDAKRFKYIVHFLSISTDVEAASAESAVLGWGSRVTMHFVFHAPSGLTSCARRLADAKALQRSSLSLPCRNPKLAIHIHFGAPFVIVYRLRYVLLISVFCRFRFLSTLLPSRWIAN